MITKRGLTLKKLWRANVWVLSFLFCSSFSVHSGWAGAKGEIVPAGDVVESLTMTPTSTYSPALTPTNTPNPCSFSYGVSLVGANREEVGKAFEFPLVIPAPVTIQEIHCYSSQAETIVAGLYNSSETLMKSVAFDSSGAGWYSLSFPITLNQRNYYLGRYGSGAFISLAAGTGTDCFYEKTNELPKNFDRRGSYNSLGTPLFLTGCRSIRSIGNLYGIGSSVMAGYGASAISNGFF
jgi:hypothetical protein